MSICKGKGSAKGFGCGNPYVQYNSLDKGLCIECRKEFLKQADNKTVDSAVFNALKQVRVIEKRLHKEKKVEILSPDKYRAKYVQPIINEIARLIDYGQPCIATGLFGKMAGGHYHSVGSNRTICLDLRNIHMQSFHSNGPTGGGDNIRYRNGIIKIYGQEYMDLIESLSKTPPIHLSKSDLEEIKEKASKIRNDLKKDLKVRSPEERIKLRNEINELIGIYK